MPWEIKEIKSYRVSVGSHSWPSISMFDDNQHFGSLLFWEREPQKKPWKNEEGFYWVYLPFSRFDSVLDILRNERPVRLMYLSDPMQENQGICAYVSTLKEPTGEEESRIESL